MKIIREHKKEEETVELDENGLELVLEEAKSRRLHKAFALKDEIGLSDQERHELAKMIPGVDPDGDGSWKNLNPKQLHDLITMMEGHLLVQTLMHQRFRQPITGQVISIPNQTTYTWPGVTYTGGTTGINASHTHSITNHTHSITNPYVYDGQNWVPFMQSSFASINTA